jgi:hypothetical protein
LLDVVVKTLGIPSEPGKRVEVTVFVAEVELLEICVTILGCILDSVIEHADFFAIDDFDAAFSPEWQLVKVKTPVLVAEKATACAYASTFCAFRFTFATVFTVCN